MQVCVTWWLFLCDCLITIRSTRLGKILRVPLARYSSKLERLQWAAADAANYCVTGITILVLVNLFGF